MPVKIYTEAGVVSGHGFEDVAYLPLDLLVAADAPVGETVTLSATVKWLICEYEICIPSGTELELALPIVGSTPPPHRTVLVSSPIVVRELPLARDRLFRG